MEQQNEKNESVGCMSIEDRLTLQLEFAKMVNIKQQIRIIEGDLLQARTADAAQIGKYTQMQQALAKKYNVDLSTTTVDDDGKFIPITLEMRQAMAANNPLRF